MKTQSRILEIADDRSSAHHAYDFGGVMYVGDEEWDLEAATALGYHFVGVAYEGAHDAFLGARADVMLDHLTDHQECLRRAYSG